jgi:hypothetical protein
MLGSRRGDRPKLVPKERLVSLRPAKYDVEKALVYYNGIGAVLWKQRMDLGRHH